MLILHGTADKTTPVNQSLRFQQAAKETGVRSELIIIEGAPHSFDLQPRAAQPPARGHWVLRQVPQAERMNPEIPSRIHRDGRRYFGSKSAPQATL